MRDSTVSSCNNLLNINWVNNNANNDCRNFAQT